jgi:CheY-like chemotaxis protein
MNLVTNAAEALGPDSRRIDVRTKMLAADRDLLRTFHLGSHLEEGRHVCIEVSDDGEGIDESVRERIFDPFFSTKLTGRGLGLAVVLGIVQSHGGALQIESERGRGTTFRIILPPARGAVLDDVPEIAQLSECDAGWQGQGTVLVADDDAGARELTQILLERAGFEVLCAVDGIEAVEIFRHDAAEIVAVVLDNTMPGKSGSEALEEIRKLQPDVPIMLISGYTRERVEESLLARGGVRFLHKPFDGEKLLAVLRALLEPKASV